MKGLKDRRLVISWARRTGAKPGQAMLELAMVAPLLFLLLFAIVDFSRFLNQEQILVDLGRQGSNMASRGTALPTVASAIVKGSAPLDLAHAGEVIVTAVARINNTDQVTGQTASGALSLSSKIGNGVGAKAVVPSSVDDIFKTNSSQTIYVTEVYYTFNQITPLAKMWNLVLPSTMYQVAYF